MSSRISVDIEDLLVGLSSHDMEYYLDLHTGDVFPWFADFPDDDDIATAMEESPERFAMLEPVPSREGYRWMEMFAANQESDDVRHALLAALSGSKPFRRFKDALLSYPNAREQWFQVEQQQLLEYARKWLEAGGFEVDVISNANSLGGNVI